MFSDVHKVTLVHFLNVYRLDEIRLPIMLSTNKASQTVYPAQGHTDKRCSADSEVWTIQHINSNSDSAEDDHTDITEYTGGSLLAVWHSQGYTD